MKHLVLQKTRYILTNSWFGLLIPSGLHQLLAASEKASEKQSTGLPPHPAEARLSRSTSSKVHP